jgi:hypothetical protein
VFRRGHRRLGRHQQAVDAPDRGAVDDGGDERLADAPVLLKRRHGQRPDFASPGLRAISLNRWNGSGMTAPTMRPLSSAASTSPVPDMPSPRRTSA